MRIVLAITTVVLASAAGAGCGPAQTPPSPQKEPDRVAPADSPPAGKAVSLARLHARNPSAVIQVASAALGTDGGIDLRHSAYGDNLSPPLRWTRVEGAQAYALILEDPDAPTPRPFVHWLVWNIPAAMTALPEAVPADPQPAGLDGAAQGRNGAGQIGYHGPEPPAGSGVHHYHIQIFALDAPLDLAPGADVSALTAAMDGHVLADGELVGTYEQPAGH